MSFLGDLFKVMTGREPQRMDKVLLPGQVAPPPPVPTQSNGLLDDRGMKIIPQIMVENLQPHRNVDKLTVTAYIHNMSDKQLRIDSIYLLKKTTRFMQLLGPHESRQLTIYRGPAPHDENEHQARILYRLQVNQDQFQATYRIGYHYDTDGTREVNQLFPDGPVRAISR